VKQFRVQSRLIRIVLLAVILLGIIHSVSPTGTAKAHHLYYTIINFYPPAEYPWFAFDMCNHPGGSYPYLPPPRWGYYGINRNVIAGNVVTTSFSTAGGATFSETEEFTADYSGENAGMLPAPAFSLPANSMFTVIVTLYQNSKYRTMGIKHMRQKFQVNCTTHIMTSNVITYY
jgi:hypothetical protein